MTTIVTLQQLEAIADAALEYHMDRGKVYWQNDQDRPLLSDAMANAKPFPGGKDNLTVRVADEYQTGIQGYQYDDTVTYNNPAALKTATYPWKLIHFGINVTHHELLNDGISVTETNGESTSRLSGRDKQVLANLFDYKIEDMKKGGDKDMDEMFWQDGSQDSKLVPGIRSIILDDPTSATTVGGIDQAANPKWRNYADLSLSTSSPGDYTIAQALQKGNRQMRRYANGAVRQKMYVGSDFIDAVEKELRANGEYSNTGFTGSRDVSVGDLRFKGTPMIYTPTLDDLGLSKYCFCIDWANIYPKYIEGENMKSHRPSRPEDKYVLYRAMTWVGGLCARQRSTSGVFSIA